MVKFDFKNGRSIKVANLTPHPVKILVYGSVIEVPVEWDIEDNKPFVLRVKEKIRDIGEFKGVKIIKKELDDKDIDYKTVEKLKELAKKNDIIIVSLPCKELIKRMLEVGAIDLNVAKKCFVIGQTVRDDEGNVLYAESLAQII